MEDVSTVVVVLLALCHTGLAIRCYSCTVPPYPGADLHTNKRNICPDISCPGPKEEQVCVKITDNRGSEEVIVRGCLWDLRSSNWAPLLPGDVFTGCRKPAVDKYLTPNDYYLNVYKQPHESIDFCFCNDWIWCNGAPQLVKSAILPGLLLALSLWHLLYA
ncbi:PREDICTED: uncharacterized protein LOC106805155 [Priapulus caudatus]|uniref:Uncharacterized protein LOC106805155 n=1 Tax=Priapulus caudatus TaxID=37621 RepID=A0ABM1DQB5_PRICU|nr:PREDICTED: uncharacterized protein LOC106805155 [Priapulus caudatus]